MRLSVLILSLVFWYEESRFFGWNARPQSAAEVICDGICLVILALGVVARR